MPDRSRFPAIMSIQVSKTDTLTEWSATPHPEPQQWSLLLRCWAASLAITFLLGMAFWHTWGPRLRQLAEMMGGLSWSLRSGIRGAGRVTLNMIREGWRNMMTTDRTYHWEVVEEPHYVEVDRMPRFPPRPKNLTRKELLIQKQLHQQLQLWWKIPVHHGQAQAQ